MDDNDNDDDCDDVNDSYSNRNNKHYWNKSTNNMDNIRTAGKCQHRCSRLWQLSVSKSKRFDAL